MTKVDRKFRFALSVNQLPESKQDWFDTVRMADDLGFAQILTGDHVGEERYASIPAFAAAAAINDRIRFGTVVFNNDFRHPVLLAKDVATLDVVTDGRYQLGVGAGWMTSDYENTGIKKNGGKIRVDRLEESVKIIKGLFGPDPVNFEGIYYQIKNLAGWPKPVQTPLPIFIGGGSERLLTMAAREANIVGLQPIHRGGVRGGGYEVSNQALSDRAKWVKNAAGDRYDEIELHMLVHAVALTDDVQAGAAKLAPRFDLTEDEAVASPYLLIGPAGKIADDVLRLREEFGLSYFSVRFSDAKSFAPVLAKLAGQ